ncbi:MAG TPA: hypothetical protein VJ865_17325 [Gemmatimonadaceae bacterium]|nr:hypothetical protein [Gemmatimonadaceae bacterium]
MHAEILLLRFIHVVGAIIWVGGGAYVAFFLIPALLPQPQLIPQVMEGLQRRKVFVILPTVGLLVVLTGIRLLWIDSAGFDESFLSTAAGRTFSIGGTAGILAFLIQVFVQRPAGARLSKLAMTLAGNVSAEERQRLTAEADRMRRRNAWGVQAAVGFGLLAATAMSIARYM